MSWFQSYENFHTSTYVYGTVWRSAEIQIRFQWPSGSVIEIWIRIQVQNMFKNQIFYQMEDLFFYLLLLAFNKGTAFKKNIPFLLRKKLFKNCRQGNEICR